jgi:hypothetical protein
MTRRDLDILAKRYDEEYVIWSHEHARWWATYCAGYVSTLDSAGRYSFIEAADIVLGHVPVGEEVAIPLRFAAQHERELREKAAKGTW